MLFKRRIIILFLFALCALAYFVGASYNDFHSYNKAYYLINHTHQVIQQIQKAADQRLTMRSELEGYITTGDKDYINGFLKTSSDLQKTLAGIQSLTENNPVQHANADSLSSFINAAIYFIDRTIINGDQSAKRSFNFLSNENAKNLFNTINRINDRMLVEENELLISRNHTYEAESKRSFFIILSGGFIAFLFLLYTFWQLNKDFLKRKKAEADLLASEAKYRKLIEGTQVVIFTSDLGGLFTFVSSQAFTLTGYTPEELQNKSYSFLVDPEWVEKVNQHYISQFKNNLPQTTLEFPIITKDGQQKWVRQLALTLYENNQPAGVQCIVIDISERRYIIQRLRRSEQERRESANLLQAIMDNSSALIFIKDLNHKYLFANKKFKEALQISEEELYGKTDYDFNSAEFAHRYHQKDEEILKGLQYIESEEMIEVKGKPHNYLVTKFPLLDADNKLFGICGIATDITERSRQQQELIDARKKAEAAEKQQEQFLATMSHEIRTPINGIIGMAHLLSSTTLNSEQQDFLQAIFESSDTLLALVNDILDFSKIKSGMLAIEKTIFSASDVMQTIQHAFSYRLSEKRLAFNIHIDPSVPDMLEGDPYRLKQIFSNLVGNAAKFTEKGYVNIDVHLKEKVADTASIEFVVEDSGIGISPEKIDKIFDSFTQAGSDISRKFGGSGLGLAITKQLIELQGGTISVSSTLGKGTSFSFIIPYHFKENQQDLSLGLQPVDFSKEFYPVNVLVAEDNLINQKVILYTLQKTGATVTITGNGKEAVEKLKGKEKFDLLLLDMQMPEMDGYETARYVREILHLDIPIIAMTATVLKGEKEKCLQMGMNGYISKPFSPRELFNQINMHLNENPSGKISPNSPGEEKFYDLGYLLQLEDDGYLLEVLTLFLDTTPVTLKEINTNILAKGWEKVYQQAHRLKSGLGMMQAQALLEVITKIEVNARDETKLDEMPDWINAAAMIYKKLEPLLEKEKEKVKARLASS
jgi:PAS domain S-box-containing protein